MADENKVTLTFDVDSKDLIDALNNVQSATKKSVQTAEKELSGFQKFGKNFAVGFQAAFGFFAAGALVDGVKKFGDVLKDAVGEAAEADQNIRNLAAAFAETGEFSDEAVNSVADFAAEIQKTTTFTDDAVVSGVALAKSFNITNEQAQELTKAAVDLAARTGTDLNSAVETLGKTYSGSTGLLAKQIPALKGLTEEQLKNGEAIRIVGEQYAGFAQNVASGTFSGALTQARNQFGEVLESLGKVITQNPVVIKALNLVGEAFGKLAKFIEDNQEELAGYVSTAIKFAAELIPPFIRFGAFVVAAFSQVASAVSQLIKGFIFFGNAVELALKVATLPFREFLNAVVLVYSTLIESTAGFIKAIPGAEKALGKLGFSLDNLQKGAKEFSDQAGKNLKDNLTDIKDSVLNLDKNTQNFVTNALDKAVTKSDQFGVSLIQISDSAEASIKGLTGIDSNVQSVTKGISNAEKATKDFGKTAKDALEEVKGSFDKLKSGSEAFQKQIEKSTLTAEQQADAELRRANELAAKATKELQLTGKLNAENQQLIKVYQQQAKQVRELFEVEQQREKVKGSFESLKKASEDITKEYEKQTLTAAQLAEKEYERALALAERATTELKLTNKLDAENQKLIDTYVEQASKQREIAELEATREKFKGSFEKIKNLNEELTKELVKQEASAKQLIDAEFERAAISAANAKIELGLSGKLTEENEKLIDQYVEMADKKRALALENLSIGDFTIGEFVDAIENQAGDITDALSAAFSGDASGITKGLKNAFTSATESLEKRLKKLTVGDVAKGFVDALETGAKVAAGIISGDFLKQGLGFIQQFAEFPQNLLKIFEEGAELFSKLADALPGIINSLVEKLPDLAAKLGSAIGSAVVSIADNLPKIVESLVSALEPLVKNLFERAIPALIRAVPGIVKALASAVAPLLETILRSLPDIIKEIFKAIPEIVKALADALPGIIEVLADNIDEIVLAFVEGFIALMPEITVALVDSLLVNGGLERIIKALIAAMPRVALAFVQGVVRGFATAAVSIGQAIGRGFVAAASNLGNKIGSDFGARIQSSFTTIFSGLYSSIVGAFGAVFGGLYSTIVSGFGAIFGSLYATIVNGFQNIFGGISNAIADGGNRLKNAFFEPVNRLIDFLNNFKFPDIGGSIGGIFGGGGGGILGGIGGAIGGAVGGVSSSLGFAEGGQVPTGFPNDSFPARLTSGELVIPPGDTERLSAFLDRQASGGGGESDLLVANLLSQILTKLSDPMSVETSVQVSGREFANIILELSRNNARLTA